MDFGTVGLTEARLRAVVHKNFQPAPTIPKVFLGQLRSFAEHFGLELKLEWDPWSHYWTVYSAERVWNDDQEKSVPTWRVFYEAVDEHGEPEPLDNRIFDEMAKGYMGDTATEKKQFSECKRGRRAKEKAGREQTILDEAIEEAEPVVKMIRDGASLEKVTGVSKTFVYDRRSKPND